MSDLKYRFDDRFIQETDWQNLYFLTENWMSDLKFFIDDLRFLHHLINKYLIWITKEQHLQMVQQMEASLFKMDKEANVLTTRAKKHLHHLVELIDNPFLYDSHLVRTEHENLENSFDTFVKEFRKNRTEVFKITEFIMDNEEMVRRLNLVAV